MEGVSLPKAEQLKSAYIWLTNCNVAEVGLSRLVGVKTPVNEFINHRLLSLEMRARGQLQFLFRWKCFTVLSIIYHAIVVKGEAPAPLFSRPW